MTRPNKKYNQAARERERKEIEQYRLGPCTDCGRTYHPSVMEFDHVRGRKIATVTMQRRRGPKQFLEELAKCDLVCANCHRYREKMRRQYMSGKAGWMINVCL